MPQWICLWISSSTFFRIALYRVYTIPYFSAPGEGNRQAEFQVGTLTRSETSRPEITSVHSIHWCCLTHWVCPALCYLLKIPPSAVFVSPQHKSTLLIINITNFEVICNLLIKPPTFTFKCPTNYLYDEPLGMGFESQKYPRQSPSVFQQQAKFGSSSTFTQPAGMPYHILSSHQQLGYVTSCLLFQVINIDSE